ncbi:Fatty acid synthase [Blattella germanica]|nr:Fatty acid synthase [Blattella germanica]
MILQKARDANRIYASVVGVDIFYQGDCQKHFLVPCGKPLEHLMESFYVSYGVNPSDIEFLEAEGNGKSDEEEMNAVDKVLLKNRKTPLLIGSVKSNMGHTQASANFCSIAKILIAIQEGLLPPNLNFNKPSSKIPALLENRAKVVCDATPWNLGLVAFNGMSMVGTYAHALLKPYRIKTTANTSNVLPYLIMASSRTEYSMQNLIDKIHVQLKPENHEFISLMHSVYSYDIAGHLYRGYTIKEAGENKFSEIKLCIDADRKIFDICTSTYSLNIRLFTKVGLQNK